jgi:methenyltetrahydrofolate cyclohydrolase
MTLEEFVSSLAQANPVPGGGSVTALAGSLAAALGEMMSGLTEGREKFSSVNAQVQRVHTELSTLRNTLSRLIREDPIAYHSLMEAKQLPQDDDKQRTARAEAIERATCTATETPVRTAQAAFEVLEHLKLLIEIGNPNARSDAAVGALMAQAAIKGALYNVITNIHDIKDAAFAEHCRIKVTGLAQKSQDMLLQIERKIISFKGE